MMYDDLSHPVGSFYWSQERTDPGKMFGGTWERIGLNFGKVNRLPCDTSSSITLTAEMMPRHSFALPLSSSVVLLDITKYITPTDYRCVSCWRRTA